MRPTMGSGAGMVGPMPGGAEQTMSVVSRQKLTMTPAAHMMPRGRAERELTVSSDERESDSTPMYTLPAHATQAVRRRPRQ